MCPHCNGADETAERLVLHCPAHDQARRKSLTKLHYQSDPSHMWSFLEKIRAVTCPPTGNEREDHTVNRTSLIKRQQCNLLVVVSIGDLRLVRLGELGVGRLVPVYVINPVSAVVVSKRTTSNIMPSPRPPK